MLRTMLLGLLCTGVVVASPMPDSGATELSSSNKSSAPDPAVCAQETRLLGSSCARTTGQVAKQVLKEGRPMVFTGRLVPTENALETNVAAPYSVGPNAVNVVANEVLEELVRFELLDYRVALEGRILDVDGVQYFVLTDFQQSSS